MDMEELLDDPDYADNTARMRNKDKLRDILNAQFGTRDAIEWTKDLMENGVPSGPIYSLDKVFNDPQVIDQGMVERVLHPTIGDLELLANPMKMSSLKGNPCARHHRSSVSITIKFSLNMDFPPKRSPPLTQRAQSASKKG